MGAVHSLTVLYCNSVEYACFDTDSAALTGIGYLDRNALNRREHLVEVVYRGMFEKAHHATAVATETYAEKLFRVRGKESGVVKIHLAGHRN
jgi:hypothetical protein